MRPSLVCLATALALVLGSTKSSASDFGDAWQNWSHGRSVELGEVEAGSGLVAISVGPDIYQHAQADLSDVRVLDAAGREVGYVLYRRSGRKTTAWRTTELSDMGFVVGEYTQVVADAGASDQLHNVLEIELGAGVRELFVWVEVALGRDRETWRVVREKAPIYRFEESGSGLPQTALQVRYPQARDRWIRLRLLAADREVPVRGVRVCEQVDEASDLIPVEDGVHRIADSPPGESRWITYPEGVGVPIAAVSFSTEREAFHRPVAISVSDEGASWRPVARGLIYRYPPEATGTGLAARPRESTRVEFPAQSARHWRVAVRDRSDPAIADLGVTLERVATSIIFEPEPGRAYRLVYGNHLAEAPRYEIGELSTPREWAAAVQVGLGPETENRAYVSPEPFTERHPVLLWIALGLVVVVLGALALKTLR